MPPRIERFPGNAETQVLALVEQIYAAATDGAQWPVLLESLAKTTDSEIVYLTAYDTATRHQVIDWRFGCDPVVVAEYEQQWAAQNPYMQAAAPLQYTGAVMQGEAIVPDSVIERTVYYNEMLRRVGVMHHSGTCLFMERSLIGFLLLNRKIGKPSHTPQDLALLRALTPHLQRAVAVQRRLQQTELERSATEAALDRLPVGVLMLDAGGSVRSCNAAARAILDQRDGLDLGATGLQAMHVTSSVELRRLVASACAPTGVAQGGGWLQIRRPSGRRPFVLLIAPLRLPHRTLGLDPPRAIVFVTDPDRAPESLEQTLARLYALTPAESNVTAQLLAGASVAELAERLEITEYTARTHLKHIFDKMNVRTQAELMRVLLSGVAGLRSSDR